MLLMILKTHAGTIRHVSVGTVLRRSVAHTIGMVSVCAMFVIVNFIIVGGFYLNGGGGQNQCS